MNQLAEDFRRHAAALAGENNDLTIMEVCGTHTESIHRFGIRDLLPPHVRLISGPGCPVCVTSAGDVSAALSAADQDGVIFTCFGDMMRVPCGRASLYSLYEKGRDIRVVTSPMDALQIAGMNPGRQVIFFGIGFETTAPLTAALIESAASGGVRNLSVLSAHKTMPAAIRALFREKSGVGALLCPGHVAAITGADAFSFIPDELGMPAVVAGFEAADIMAALLVAFQLVRSKSLKCVNAYPRAVTDAGNRQAMRLLGQVFEPCEASWRGLGVIPGSGLRIRGRYAGYDAARRFGLSAGPESDHPGCICGRILRGAGVPADCPAFGKACTPDTPLGACMVSSEGSCSISFRYGGEGGA